MGLRGMKRVCDGDLGRVAKIVLLWRACHEYVVFPFSASSVLDLWLLLAILSAISLKLCYRHCLRFAPSPADQADTF